MASDKKLERFIVPKGEDGLPTEEDLEALFQALTDDLVNEQDDNEASSPES